MHCLFNSLGHDTNYLYPTIKQMVSSLSVILTWRYQLEILNLICIVCFQVEGFGNMIVLNGKQELILHIIKQLLGRWCILDCVLSNYDPLNANTINFDRNGNICFDAATKTKTVENLLSKVKSHSLRQCKLFQYFETALSECYDYLKWRNFSYD